ncbi:hypothetical protein [Flavobacterium wongokense]|uniref:hypothetical protein n=1 Tax=Flavobacterium wongokense TaxID=2910674 RepID=UPI001F414AD1|nr:hypothetical protein [Flavobacterium sp. WG47]MCF6131939.1 hypothetical protein [Flavobacterium sp. WG47]
MKLLELLGFENNDKSISERLETYHKEKKAYEKEVRKMRKKEGYWKRLLGSKDKGIWTPYD